MKRLRPSLVVTVSLSLAACGGARTADPPPPEMSHNPPMPPLGGQGGSGSAETPAGGAGAGAMEVASATATPPYTSKNPPPPDMGGPKGGGFVAHPRDAQGHVIYKDRQGGCYVEIQVPHDKPLPPGGQSIRVEKRTCPPAMNDPAYAKCAGGTISRAGAECSCFIGGNPPPPQTILACPAQ